MCDYLLLGVCFLLVLMTIYAWTLTQDINAAKASAKAMESKHRAKRAKDREEILRKAERMTHEELVNDLNRGFNL